MPWVKFLLSLLSTGALLVTLMIPLGSVTFSFGNFFNPFSGFWQNAEPVNEGANQELDLPGLEGEASVVFDDRRVPHIFAENQKDLAYVQGYVTAQDRLWQMEFQIYAASGRLTELIGAGAENRVLDMDRTARRKGITFAAERAVEEFKKYPEVKDFVEAYIEGVNDYIRQLKPKDYPIEYKILNYQPEEWTAQKSALLMKYMANTLATRAKDIEHTNALILFGQKTFDILYPEYSYAEDPIVPADTRYNYRLANPRPLVPLDYHPDSLMLSPALMDKPDRNIGSNNWAISGAKSTTGKPILANDPHLGLNLPSIWYEIQLTAPGYKAYGVSLPGGPGVVIGFNDSIAWGETNAGQDVMDFYKTRFRDDRKQEYFYDGQWYPVNERIEEYKLKGGGSVFDTVLYTNVGPVMYDESFGDQPFPLAVRWMAHEPSCEMVTFYKLNKAKNYQDYLEALTYFKSPAQNFVFASNAGDIAIWQQGSFVNKWEGQGKFVLDGTKRDQFWGEFIPQDQNPHSYNPARGFVSSANQHPAPESYPYYYLGGFEDYRNRRLNQLLAAKEKLSVDDMKRIQLDNFSVKAQDLLAIILPELDTTVFTQPEWKAYRMLENWDYMYDKDEPAATLFEKWWVELYRAIWVDEFAEIEVPMDYPSSSTTIGILRDSIEFTFYRDKNDTTKKDRKSLVNITFDKVTGQLYNEYESESEWEWSKIKQTNILHLTRVLSPFSRLNIPTDGNNNILNATSERHGPSWRMVVALGDEIEAYGVYPGGQSGNPGSKYYDSFIDDWSNGQYYKLWYMRDQNDTNGEISMKQLFK
ncbi:MAG: penicillin acylase family protein [Bacteroidetes bacterium]|nr:penicillin acylase family protein [Bacteroidota bacterium]